MVFSQSKDFDENEIQLAKHFLEKLIGENKSFCRQQTENEGFIYLDHWNDKMGFVKENQSKYLILSLHFENNECYFYQLIIKESGNKWKDGKILDYNTAREIGIVEKSKDQPPDLFPK